jgi:hypothetical protein
MEINLSEKELKSALALYEKHKACCRRYQQRNKEKVNENAKRYYESMRNDPEKYEKYLERCRGRYVPVEVRRQRQKAVAEQTPENV